MSTLESMKAYYETEDFREGYYPALIADLMAYGPDQIRRLEDSDWCYNENDYPKLTKENITTIINFILGHLDKFAKRYRNYYVGDDCIASVSFGEQETEIPEDFKDGDDDHGFYIGDNGYAYFDMSDEGLYISLIEEQAHNIIKEVGGSNV